MGQMETIHVEVISLVKHACVNEMTVFQLVIKLKELDTFQFFFLFNYIIAWLSFSSLLCKMPRMLNEIRQS